MQCLDLTQLHNWWTGNLKKMYCFNHFSPNFYVGKCTFNTGRCFSLMLCFNIIDQSLYFILFITCKYDYLAHLMNTFSVPDLTVDSCVLSKNRTLDIHRIDNFNHDSIT